MKKIKLTEKDLQNIIARIIKEQDEMTRMEPQEFSEIKTKVQDFINDIDFNDTEKWQKTMNFLMESNKDAYNMMRSIGNRGESSVRSLIEILGAMNAIYKSSDF